MQLWPHSAHRRLLCRSIRYDSRLAYCFRSAGRDSIRIRRSFRRRIACKFTPSSARLLLCRQAAPLSNRSRPKFVITAASRHRGYLRNYIGSRRTPDLVKKLLFIRFLSRRPSYIASEVISTPAASLPLCRGILFRVFTPCHYCAPSAGFIGHEQPTSAIPQTIASCASAKTPAAFGASRDSIGLARNVRRMLSIADTLLVTALNAYHTRWHLSAFTALTIA